MNALKIASPVVWRAAVIRQYVRAVTNPLLPIFFLVCAFLIHRWFKNFIDHFYTESQVLGSKAFWINISLIASKFLVGIWLVQAITMSFAYAVCPELFATHDVMNMVLNRGMNP